MSKVDETTSVITKRKNIQTLIDYCLDHKIAFSVSPRSISIDEFEVSLEIPSIKQAVALGIFFKENKFEVFGLGDLVKAKTVSANRRSETKEPEAAVNGIDKNTTAEEEGSTLNFDLNVNSN